MVISRHIFIWGMSIGLALCWMVAVAGAVIAVGRVHDAYLLGMAMAVMLFAILFMPLVVSAQEHHDHAALGEAGQFYSTWNRPKGHYSGIGHRTQSCCNRTDCRPVDQVEIKNGQIWARLENSYEWYKVDPSIIESNQGDPRDSPDGRSHGCVIGGVMACFVEGSGG